MDAITIREKANSQGVIRIIQPAEKHYYKNEDVCKLLGVSKSKASEMIAALRRELVQEGKITETYPAGKVPKKYFNERCGID